MRQAQFLIQRYKIILAYSSLLNLFTSLLILSPLILLFVYPDESKYAWAFYLPSLALALPSFIIWLTLKPSNTVHLKWQEGAVIIVLSWLLAMLVGALPFIAINDLNFTQAFFESTSGWTTAGLSVIDVEESSPLILFYRSVTQLAGGAGLAIIMLSALAGPAGTGITSAEGRSQQLLPNVRRSARLVIVLYAGYVVAGILALYVAGMSWFDAINHAFTSVSTGGFSTKSNSIDFWNSPAIEVVIIILMLLGTLNFLTAYLLMQRKFRAVFKNIEVRLNNLLVLISFLVLLFLVSWELYPSLGERIRVSLFNAISAVSTTGYATVSYTNWNGLGILILIVLMLIGGGSGSTAGGIKQYRIVVILKGMLWGFRRQLVSRKSIKEPEVFIGQERRFLNDRRIRVVSLFVLLYLGVFLLGGSILAAHGYTLRDSLFEAASALSTVGLSVGITSPNAPVIVLWTEILVMFLGRLEFYTIIIGFIKIFTDSRDIFRGLRNK